MVFPGFFSRHLMHHVSHPHLIVFQADLFGRWRLPASDCGVPCDPRPPQRGLSKCPKCFPPPAPQPHAWPTDLAP